MSQVEREREREREREMELPNHHGRRLTNIVAVGWRCDRVTVPRRATLRGPSTSSRSLTAAASYKTGVVNLWTPPPTLTYMSSSDDKLPPPIYLPSSGGYTSSHLPEQVPSTPFRCVSNRSRNSSGSRPTYLCISAVQRGPGWEVSCSDEKYWTRRVSHGIGHRHGDLWVPDTHRDISRRAKPYETPSKRPSRAATTAATPKPSDTAVADKTTTSGLFEAPKTKQPDATTVTRLFQLLIPIMVKDPTAFESKASVICAAMDLDTAATADVIDTVKRSLSSDSKSERVFFPSFRLAI